MHGQIPDMEFIDEIIGDVLTGVGIRVLLPAFGIGAAQIQNHGPVAVDAGGAGVGVAGLADLAVHHHQIGIVDPVPVAGNFGHPGAPDVGLHRNLLEQIVSVDIAAAVKVDGDLLGGRRPEPEAGLLSSPDSAQIGTGVSIFFFKFFG